MKTIRRRKVNARALTDKAKSRIFSALIELDERQKYRPHRLEA